MNAFIGASVVLVTVFLIGFRLGHYYGYWNGLGDEKTWLRSVSGNLKRRKA